MLGRLRPLLPALVIGCSCAGGAAPPTVERPPASAVRAASKPADTAPVRRDEKLMRQAAPAPKYDLAADLDARRRELRSELGERAEAEVVENVFLIVTPKGRAGLAGAVDVTKKALAAYFNGRFSRRPERAVSVYLFPNAQSYGAYCRSRWESACSSPYGFYLGDERKIVMNVGPGIGTLTHELVHPLVEADFPGAPDWLNEGIASLYEGFHFPRPGEIRGTKNWRHARLVAALGAPKERERARPSALFGMTDDVFRGEGEDLSYATARYFCQWLESRDQLWAFYQRWRDTVDSDPTGEKAFASVTGATPAEIDAEWTRWVRRL